MSKEKVQISPVQLTFLFITLVISTADIFLPSYVAQEAKRDSWISAILASLMMIPVLFVYLKLYKNHEGKSLVEMFTGIVGSFAGRIIGFMYAFYFFTVAIGAIMSLSIVLNTTFLNLTPSWVIVVISILVAMYGAGSNVEVIARVNEILLPAGMGALVFLLLLNIGEYDFNFFRPVLAEGILPPVRGSIVILGYLCETIVIMQMVHFVNKPEKIKLALFMGLLFTSTSFLSGTLIYAVFGPLTEIFVTPSLELARFSSIGKYIQNLDVLILAIWITGIYVKIMIFIYSGSYAVAQVFRLKDYKSVIFPIGFFISGVAVSNINVRVTELDFMHYIVPIYGITMALIIPGTLLIVCIIKNKVKVKGKGEKGK